MSDPSRLPPARGPTLTGSGEKMDLRSCVDAVLVAGAPGAPDR